MILIPRDPLFANFVLYFLCIFPKISDAAVDLMGAGKDSNFTIDLLRDNLVADEGNEF